MALFAVSDLHIWGTEDPLYRSLLSCCATVLALAIRSCLLAISSINIFVGNKRVFVKENERYREFFVELEAAGNRGAKIHYIEGDHDFHLRKAFARIPGFVLHPRDFEIELGGRRFSSPMETWWIARTMAIGRSACFSKACRDEGRSGAHARSRWSSGRARSSRVSREAKPGCPCSCLPAAWSIPQYLS